MADRIKSYNEFYCFYLTEHRNKTNRILHFIGTFLVFVLLFLALYNGWSWEWVFLPQVGYGFGRVGHAFFERNKPATFQYPFWSLLSDFKLFFEILSGRKSFDAAKD